ATQLARSTGIPATHREGFGGTRLVWEALLRGDIDVYPEYTGTLRQELLPGTTPDGVDQALAARGLGALGPLGLNNTYAIGVVCPGSARLGLRTISDLRAQPELRFGFSSEFMSRRDGWP